MPEQKIDPQKVTRPMQLLAAWLVALILIDGTFLTAASIVSTPDWVPGILVIGAIANVPIFLVGMFFLQTKYRKEMLSDDYYSHYLQEQNKLNDLGSELKSFLEDAGIDSEKLASGQSLSDVSKDIQQKIDASLTEMRQMFRDIDNAQPEVIKEVEPETVLAFAKALMAIGAWTEAAQQFDEYVKHHPSDWRIQYSRAVAHANIRGGLPSNLAALRAYNEAIAFVPAGTDRNTRARLFAYRGAILKRLKRLDEAEADLLIAQEYATANYEINDVKYNLAGVYALKSNRQKLLKIVGELRNQPRILLAIQAHLEDYFADFADDEEFLRAINV